MMRLWIKLVVVLLCVVSLTAWTGSVASASPCNDHANPAIGHGQHVAMTLTQAHAVDYHSKGATAPMELAFCQAACAACASMLPVVATTVTEPKSFAVRFLRLDDALRTGLDVAPQHVPPKVSV